MKTTFRNLLLAGVAFAAFSAASAQAQVQTPGFFGSLTGWYWLNSGNDKDNGNPIFVPTLQGSPDDGWGGRGYLGYRFLGGMDIAGGFQISDISKGKGNNGAVSGTAAADYWAADGELGYNFSGMSTTAVRVFIGGRYAEFDHSDKSSVGPSRKVDFHGWGPRVGVDFAARFAPNSSLSVVGNVSGSYLFGKIRDSDNTGGITSNRKRNVWQGDAQLGLDWEFSPLAHLTVGYRVDYWNNIGDSSSADKYGGTDSKTDRLMHGPFVRVAYNIGAPVGPAPMAAPAAPAAAMAKSYIVFFDFDRSNLTPTALGTIKQAADAAKAGKSARVNVTGHADKSGSDQYNMALSLRRANAVKDELVRQGIPAASIVVVGRGESQPLVPTADGVKEPQNRRVEIVLN